MKLYSILTTMVVALGMTAMDSPRAQSYPSKPITLVVPYGAGGSTDALARIVAQKLEGRLGQPVIVENKPGGGTVIATNYIQRAAPDGYTLYLTGGFLPTLPLTNPSIAKYDGVADFTHIAQVASMVLVVVSNPHRPYKTFKEFLDYAKQNPGKVNISTTGPTEQMFMEALALRGGGLKFNYIAYKSGADAVQALLNDSVDAKFDGMPSSRAFIDSGKIKALATLEAGRHPNFPTIPSASETIPGLAFFSYYGVSGPKGMPEAVVERITRELAAVAAMPEFVEKAAAMGLDAKFGKSSEYAITIKNDYELWKGVIKTAGLKFE